MHADGKSTLASVPKWNSRKVNSHCKTPKQIGLAMSMKHITGSRILLKLLNSLRHLTSYDDVHLLDTAMATSVISNLAEGETYLPTNISPDTSSQAAVDNIDINEETRSRKGTTHVLGSVIYQEQRNTDIAIGFRQEQHRRQVRTMYNTSGINMLNYPNQHKGHTAPSHLLVRVNVNYWFFVLRTNCTCLLVCSQHTYMI